MKILLVQTAFLGDVILSTPVIEELASSLSVDDELDVLTTKAAAPLLDSNPHVRRIHSFDKRGAHKGVRGLLRMAKVLRAECYDRVYALQRSYRTSLLLFVAGIPERIGFADAHLSFLYTQRRKKPVGTHAVFRFLSIALDRDLFPAWNDTLGAEELERFRPQLYTQVPGAFEEKYSSILERPYVLMAPGSVWETKRWWWKRFAELASEIHRYGVTVVLVGSGSEKESCKKVAAFSPCVDLSGKTSLEELVGLVRECSAVVCNDSMVLHVASAFAKPTVAVFCATSPSFGFGPWGNAGIVLEKDDLRCKPCARHGGRFCPTGTELCMRSVSGSRAFKALRYLDREREGVFLNKSGEGAAIPS